MAIPAGTKMVIDEYVPAAGLRADASGILGEEVAWAAMGVVGIGNRPGRWSGRKRPPATQPTTSPVARVAVNLIGADLALPLGIRVPARIAANFAARIAANSAARIASCGATGAGFRTISATAAEPTGAALAVRTAAAAQAGCQRDRQERQQGAFHIPTIPFYRVRSKQEHRDGGLFADGRSSRFHRSGT